MGMDMQMDIIEKKCCSACQDLLVESSFSHRQWMVGPKRRCWQCNMQNKKRRDVESDEHYFDGVVEISKKAPPAIPAPMSQPTDRASSSMSLDSSASDIGQEEWADDQDEWFLVADTFDIEEAMLGDSAGAGAAYA